MHGHNIQAPGLRRGVQTTAHRGETTRGEPMLSRVNFVLGCTFTFNASIQLSSSSTQCRRPRKTAIWHWQWGFINSLLHPVSRFYENWVCNDHWSVRVLLLLLQLSMSIYWEIIISMCSRFLCFTLTLLHQHLWNWITCSAQPGLKYFFVHYVIFLPS